VPGNKDRRLTVENDRSLAEDVIVVSNERVPFAAHYDGSAIVRGC
jgi:hypothetical protein